MLQLNKQLRKVEMTQRWGTTISNTSHQNLLRGSKWLQMFDQPGTCIVSNKTLCPDLDRRETFSRISLNGMRKGRTLGRRQTDEKLGQTLDQ
jgi:hypothetical protein